MYRKKHSIHRVWNPPRIRGRGILYLHILHCLKLFNYITAYSALCRRYVSKKNCLKMKSYFPSEEHCHFKDYILFIFIETQLAVVLHTLCFCAPESSSQFINYT